MDSLTVRHFFQFRYVPNLHGLIPASRDQAPAVGAERDAADEAGVAAEGADQLSGMAVPDFHRAILPGGAAPPAIVAGAERPPLHLPPASPPPLPPPASDA